LKNSNFGKNTNNDVAWATISENINNICRNRNIPETIANQIVPRKKSANITSGTAYSFPLNIYIFISDIISKITSLFRKKKMLVIFIDRVSFEGRKWKNTGNDNTK
jgi:hypothetical protein